MIHQPMEDIREGIRSTAFPNDIKREYKEETGTALTVDKVPEMIADWRRETNYF